MYIVEFHKIISCFSDIFPNEAEAVNHWHSGDLIGYQVQSLMQNNCAVLIRIESINLSEFVSIFFYFYLLSFYRSVKVPLLKDLRYVLW